MKRILCTLVLFCTTIAFTQEKNFEDEVQKIAKQIELITAKEKALLKEKVTLIDQRLENNEIIAKQAKKLKKEAAEFHAQVIAMKVTSLEAMLQLLVQDKANGKIESKAKSETYFHDENTFTIGRRTFKVHVDNNNDDDDDDVQLHKPKKKKNYRRTTSQFVFALGFNNVVNNHEIGSLEDSNYQFWKSHFYELGWTWRTRMTSEASSLYFKYGVSFLWNNLRAENNMYHTIDGNQTVLKVYPEALSENRLRHVQMNFPMHFEWDFSKGNVTANRYRKYRSNRSFRFGIGGFAGFKLGTRQYLAYTNSNNIKIEELQRNNFNMQVFTYGLSTYVAYKSTGIYMKYDLNSLFKDTEQRQLSLGVRFDFD